MTDKISSREYGAKGTVGIGVPQANPTVEQEAFALRPAGMSIVTTRLTSSAPDLEQRLVEYYENTLDFVGQFDDLKIDAFGLACTGSSYLLGQTREQELLDGFSAELGIPIVTAAEAIRSNLEHLNARRIAIVSPYPDWLVERARAFWEDAGIAVSTIRSVPLESANVHTIYSLRSADALAQALKIDLDGVDAIVYTGTGMPTLGAINPLKEATGLPVLSSNLCLMSRLANEIGASDTELLSISDSLDTTTL